MTGGASDGVFDGVLVVDKPPGPTSHDVVVCARRALGVRRIGHTGTLDPFATGVLPLVVGRATRLAQFLSSREKVYDACIRLGWATDTCDATGTRVGSATTAFSPSTSDAARVGLVQAALGQFRGSYSQTPPAYSAKRINGAHAYEIARTARPVRPAPVAVTVHDLTLERIDGDRVHVRVCCSAGYYVRSLAQDLGVALGCGAHLESLRRTRSGDFDLADAVTLAALDREPAQTMSRIVPLDRLLSHLPATWLTETGAEHARHGSLVREPHMCGGTSSFPPDVSRLCDRDGHLLGLARMVEDAQGRALHPFLVLG